MRGSTSVGYDQFETSPEAIEQELRPAVCERRLTDRLKTNYSIDVYHNRHCVSCMSVFHCFTIFVPVLCCVDVVSRNTGRWPNGLERWLALATGRCGTGSNPAADNFASVLWQFRLPRLVSVFRRIHYQNQNQNQNYFYSTHVVAVGTNNILLYSFEYENSM